VLHRKDGSYFILNYLYTHGDGESENYIHHLGGRKIPDFFKSYNQEMYEPLKDINISFLMYTKTL
jgi:hypothetical protein